MRDRESHELQCPGTWHLAELEQNWELLVGDMLWERSWERRRTNEVTFQRKNVICAKLQLGGVQGILSSPIDWKNSRKNEKEGKRGRWS